jgi:hypothetical protein
MHDENVSVEGIFVDEIDKHLSLQKQKVKCFKYDRFTV